MGTLGISMWTSSFLQLIQLDYGLSKFVKVHCEECNRYAWYITLRTWVQVYGLHLTEL